MLEIFNTFVKMDSKQIEILDKLGINTNKNSIEVFEDLLYLAEWLSEEIELDEIKRFQKEINRVLKPNN